MEYENSNIKSSETLNRIQTSYQKSNIRINKKIVVETKVTNPVSDKSSVYSPQLSFGYP
jgi:hypothetical protein